MVEAVTRPAHPRIRIYLHLRSAHLERAQKLAAATILYGEARYDLDTSLFDGLDVVKVGFAGLLKALSRSAFTAIEINEPLMRAGLPRATVALVVARTAGGLRRQRPSIVAYAIENKDPFVQLNASLKHRARLSLDRCLARFVLRHVDRLAFGTAGSRQLYHELFGADFITGATRVIEAIPTACDCGNLHEHEPDTVLFVGALHSRKGFEELLAAWKILRERRPNAHLTIVGKGVLEEVARSTVAGDPRVALIIDPPRAEVHLQLRRASVLVLLSQSRPTWREQVGLPLVEALAHGVGVVTTDETGLATWLRGHGHVVLPSAAAADKVADAIEVALASGRTAQAVLDDLPDTDGRLAADDWIFDVSRS